MYLFRESNRPFNVSIWVGRRGHRIAGQLVWLNKTGQTQTVEMEGRQFGHPQIPNGQFIAVTVYEPDGDHDIWVWDLNRKTLGRRTFEGRGSHSIWSTDSERHYSFGAEGIRVVLL